MRRNLIILEIVIVVCMVVNIAAIRRKDSPVLRTQTDPIRYDEKMEEVKDGEKGPPLPSIRRYKQSGFQVHTPMDEEEQVSSTPSDRIPDADDRIPEDLSGLEEEESFDEWWTEAWVEEPQEDTEAENEEVWEDTWQDEWSKDAW